jgi:hypothetical protein
MHTACCVAAQYVLLHASGLGLHAPGPMQRIVWYFLMSFSETPGPSFSCSGSICTTSGSGRAKSGTALCSVLRSHSTSSSSISCAGMSMCCTKIRLRRAYDFLFEMWLACHSHGCALARPAQQLAVRLLAVHGTADRTLRWHSELKIGCVREGD